MAKDKTKKKAGGERSKSKARSGAAASPASGKVRKVVTEAKKLASNPAVTEIVAATLVAAAAALRDPKKARALAAEAAADLGKAAKTGAQGGALWQLALDVAQRSMDTLEAGKDAGKKKKGAGGKKK